jgi:hypothetical protein
MKSRAASARALASLFPSSLTISLKAIAVNVSFPLLGESGVCLPAEYQIAEASA